jgi:hypothetical protein
VSRTASFTSYTRHSFGEPEQRRLAAVFAALAARGCSCMLSNSYTPLILDLYRAFDMEDRAGDAGDQLEGRRPRRSEGSNRAQLFGRDQCTVGARLDGRWRTEPANAREAGSQQRASMHSTEIQTLLCPPSG